jgi:hypothetical protein
MRKTPPNPSLKRSLERYGAMTGAFLGVAGAAQAGVVYTDVDPDAVVNNGLFEIDMNGDSIVDFTITHTGSFSTFTTTYGTYGFAFDFAALRGDISAGYGFVAPSAGNFFADALSSGVTIGPASPLTINTFASIGFASTFGGSGFSSGLWSGEQDKYFGVYFNVGADTYYGWIRADVSAGYTSVTIKGFAYEDQAGVPIAAGDEGSTVCSSASPPSNQAHVNEATRVRLSWDPQPGAVACQVNGQRLPTGPSPSVNILSGDIGTTNVPYAAAGAGTMWTWRVRCACSISPLDVSAFTAYGDTFSVPVARQADAPVVDLTAYPNPATDRVLLGLGDAVSRETQVRVLDLTGNVVDFMQVPADARNMELDVAALPNGVYFVQVGDLKPVSLEVIH